MSKTSLFSPAVFRRNLRGYWPLWAGYLIIMIIGIPITAYNCFNTRTGMAAEDAVSMLFSTSMSFSRYVGFVFAVCAAMAVFSFMYSAKAANMTASLPIKRESTFFTCVASILSVVISVHVITALVTIAVELSLGAFHITYIFKWLALGILETFIFTALAVFCAVLTGHILVLPCVYAIFNFAVLLLFSLLQAVFDAFLFGYTANLPEFVSWLTPVVRLHEAFYNYHAMASGNYFTTIFVYIAAGLVMLVGALLIFRSRPNERATDVVAVKILRPVTKYCAAAAGSLTIGLLIYTLIFETLESPVVPVFIICLLIGGFIGYIAADMLIKKTFRVFKKLWGYAIYAVAAILFVFALKYDVMGYETRVPDPNTVKFACVYFGDFTYSSTEAESIEAITKLHEKCLENRSEGYGYRRTRVDYIFDDGTEMSRDYYVPLSDSALEVFNTPEIRLSSIKLSEGTTADDIQYASVSFNYDAEHSYYDSSYFSLDLTPEQYLELYETCIVPDTADSSLGSILTDNRLCLTVDAYICDEYLSLYITSDASRTLAYLENLGIIISAVLPYDG